MILPEVIKKRKKIIIAAGILIIILLILSFTLIFLYYKRNPAAKYPGGSGWSEPDWVEVNLIPPNEYSRPETKLDSVSGLVIHYVANPGTSAEANRSYFANLAKTKTTYASSHFIIGLEGEVIQLIPTNEVAYASNSRNNDTLSIECTHPTDTGEFNSATYDSLVALCANLSLEYSLDPKTDIIRHYDVTGKLCPLWYVENEDEWLEFLDDVDDVLRILKTN